jgi:daunorubicin resistance ABC transporter, ATP-binding protein
MTVALQTKGLEKKYKDVCALNGLDLTVKRGSVHGILGPNGAGKTTTIRILSTLASATGGTAVVCGRDVNQDPRGVRSSIALTGQFTALDERLTGRENLIMIGRLFGLSKEDATTSAERLLADFDLEDAADRPVRTYSGGMQRRLDLAASLSGSPEVIFLDEPTAGLDPRARLAVWDMVRDLATRNVTVVLTTQSLDEADTLSTDLTVIDRGRAVATGTPAELKEKIGGRRVIIPFQNHEGEHLAAVLRGRLSDVRVDDEAQLVSAAWVKDKESLGALILYLRDHGIDIAQIQVKELTLDDVFLALTGHNAKSQQRSRKEQK